MKIVGVIITFLLLLSTFLVLNGQATRPDAAFCWTARHHSDTYSLLIIRHNKKDIVVGGRNDLHYLCLDLMASVYGTENEY